MAPYNFRGGYVTGNRSRGFNTNKRTSFNNNNFNNRSLAGFSRNRSHESILKRTNRLSNNTGSRNFTDARQILQQKKFGNRSQGNFSDLSQKLVSRTRTGVNYVRRGAGGGRIRTNPRHSGQLNTRMGANVNLQHRFLNNSAVVNNSDRNKFIKVHRGGITVTTKRNFYQKRQHVPVRDELEDMTLDDLPQLERAVQPQPLSHSLEARLQSRNQNTRGNASATVLVSNLKNSVTEEDIHELFGAVGQMTSAQLVHPGTALVSFMDKESALMAVEQYHNITLDGVVMHCSILSSDKQSARPSLSSRLGDRSSSNNGDQTSSNNGDRTSSNNGDQTSSDNCDQTSSESGDRTKSDVGYRTSSNNSSFLPAVSANNVSNFEMQAAGRHFRIPSSVYSSFLPANGVQNFGMQAVGLPFQISSGSVYSSFLPAVPLNNVPNFGMQTAGCRFQISTSSIYSSFMPANNVPNFEMQAASLRFQFSTSSVYSSILPGNNVPNFGMQVGGLRF